MIKGPLIYRDASRIYLDFNGTIFPFELSVNGLTDAIRHIPWLAGSKDEPKRQLKPDWTIQGRDKHGRFVKPNVAKNTAAKRREESTSPDLKRAADEALASIKKGKV